MAHTHTLTMCGFWAGDRRRRHSSFKKGEGCVCVSSCKDVPWKKKKDIFFTKQRLYQLNILNIYIYIASS